DTMLLAYTAEAWLGRWISARPDPPRSQHVPYPGNSFHRSSQLAVVLRASIEVRRTAVDETDSRNVKCQDALGVSVLCALGTTVCARRSKGPKHPTCGPASTASGRSPASTVPSGLARQGGNQASKLSVLPADAPRRTTATCR